MSIVTLICTLMPYNENEINSVDINVCYVGFNLFSQTYYIGYIKGVVFWVEKGIPVCNFNLKFFYYNVNYTVLLCTFTLRTHKHISARLFIYSFLEHLANKCFCINAFHKIIYFSWFVADSWL